MCSLFDLTRPPKLVAETFGLKTIDDFPPREMIRPAQPAGIIRNDYRDKRGFFLAKWGLLPSWVKDPRDFPLLFNARSETVLVKHSFKAAIHHRRCIFPVTGFYEWAGEKGARVPIRYVPADDGVMGLAGLWEDYLAPDGSQIDTATILTVKANELVGKRHDRMPAILQAIDFDNWLNCKDVLAKEAVSMLKPVPSGMVRCDEGVQTI